MQSLSCRHAAASRPCVSRRQHRRRPAAAAAAAAAPLLPTCGGIATQRRRRRRSTPARSSSDQEQQTEQQQQLQQQQQQQGDGSGDGAGDAAGLSTRLAQLAAEVVASPLFYLVAGLATIKLVASTGEQTATVLVAAALPVTLLTALSKSSLGKRVQDSLNAKLPELQAAADALRARHAEARARSRWYGPGRPLLPRALGGGGRAPHLAGDAAGDVGFDPLQLAAQPGAFARLQEAELLHARWAMLGAVGALVPEALDLFAGVDVGEPVWWRVGAAKLRGDVTINWGGIEGFRIAGKQGIAVIAACQAVLMGGPEYARQVGIRSLEPVGVFLPGDQNYPGGAPFDPLGFSQDADGFVEQAVREIWVGRLAMLAFLGYFAQAAATREGPLRNLLDFAADPAGHNAAGYLSGAVARGGGGGV